MSVIKFQENTLRTHDAVHGVGRLSRVCRYATHESRASYTQKEYSTPTKIVHCAHKVDIIIYVTMCACVLCIQKVKEANELTEDGMDLPVLREPHVEHYMSTTSMTVVCSCSEKSSNNFCCFSL